MICCFGQRRNSTEVARKPAHLGAEISFFSVLHTWNQKLQLHPHVHCVVPASELSLDHRRWIARTQASSFPLRYCGACFVASSSPPESCLRTPSTALAGELAPLTHPKSSLLLRRSSAKIGSSTPNHPSRTEYVLQYLAATPTASPSPTIACRVTTIKSPSAGRSADTIKETDDCAREFVASYFTCSQRASSASATSASSPTEGAPPCCHGASPLSTPLPRNTNRKHRPLLQRTRCGAVPSAADRWPSSNDSPRHNSNSVLHHSWPPLHEITRPHTAPSARFRASRRSVSRYTQTSSSCPRLGSLRPSTRLCTGRRLLLYRP